MGTQNKMLLLTSLQTNEKEIIHSFFLALIKEEAANEAKKHWSGSTKILPSTAWPLVCREFHALHHAKASRLFFCAELNFQARVNNAQWLEYFKAHGIDARRCSLAKGAICLVSTPVDAAMNTLQLDHGSGHVHTKNAGSLWALSKCLFVMKELDIARFVERIELQLFVPSTKQVIPEDARLEYNDGFSPFFSDKSKEWLVEGFAGLGALKQFHMRVVESPGVDEDMQYHYLESVLKPLYMCFRNSKLLAEPAKRLTRRLFFEHDPLLGKDTELVHFDESRLQPFLRCTVVGRFLARLASVTYIGATPAKEEDAADCSFSILFGASADDDGPKIRLAWHSAAVAAAE